MLAAALATLAVIIPWHPGSQQSPLSAAGFHHGGPEACWRFDDWPRGVWECALLTRSCRAARGDRCPRIRRPFALDKPRRRH